MRSEDRWYWIPRPTSIVEGIVVLIQLENEFSTNKLTLYPTFLVCLSSERSQRQCLLASAWISRKPLENVLEYAIVCVSMRALDILYAASIWGSYPWIMSMHYEIPSLFERYSKDIDVLQQCIMTTLPYPTLWRRHPLITFPPILLFVALCEFSLHGK